ncbi:anillin isoform X2 [Clupea harengus]|uniref:Anillin n=1 Tax=Clupea harengus TaxID=7950 RepID=A0A6P8GW73_CLUHA|nr:anillin isoform X2 [Clupea harengus]
MDPFTEKLLERTRARRENLQKKMADRPTGANRPMAKRNREPLAENNSLISETPVEKVPPSAKPSPSKRRCSDENALKVPEAESKQPVVSHTHTPPSTERVVDRKPPRAPASVHFALSSSLERAAPTPAPAPTPPPSEPLAVTPKPTPEVEKMAVTPKPAPEVERMAVSPPEEVPRGRNMETKPSVPPPEREGPTDSSAPTANAMRSRLQRLAAQRHNWDAEGPADAVVTEASCLSPHKAQRYDMPPDPEPPSSGMGRKGRFANLAATIGSWEDDLSHAAVRKDNAQGAPAKPGTASSAARAPPPASSAPRACAPTQQTPAASQHAPGARQPPPYSPVKSSRVVLPSAQHTEVPERRPAQQTSRGLPSPVSSPQKTPLSKQPSGPPSRGLLPASPQKSLSSLGATAPQSPLKTQGSSRDLDLGKGVVGASPQKPTQSSKPSAAASAPSQSQSRERGARDAPPAQSKGAAGTPGVKSFLERFGERCQELNTKNSPSAAKGSPTTPTAASAVTPKSRLVQERLTKIQGTTTTADLTQKQKMERELELSQIRSRFQKGNSSENKQEVVKEKVDPQESEVSDEPLAPSGGDLSIAAETKSAERHLKPPATLTSSPLKKVDVSTEKKSEELKEVQKYGAERSRDMRVEEEEEVEKEMNVDGSINSAVINDLFDGVLGESNELSGDDDDEEEGGLNISSMSLLTPMVETVAAVVKSPERKHMTSTPASSFLEKSSTPESASSRPNRFQRARMLKAGSADSLESADGEQNLLYSIDAYRSTRVKTETERQHVKQVIVRKEDVSQRAELQPRAASHVSIKQRMKDLTNELNMQQTVISQASQALNCCTDEEHGKGSQVEAEAERLLLIATERRLGLKAELDRLKAEGPGAERRAPDGAAASKGSISLLELRLPLKADFVCAAANKPESSSHYFFVMIRSGAENTVATPLASTRSAISGDALTFSTKFTLPHVSNDFEIDIEVYYLVQKRELNAEKKKKPTKSKAITPKRFLSKSNLQTPVVASPGGPNAVRTSHFILVGSHKLTLASIGKNKFPLEKVPFLCPLEGHIYLKMQCEVGSRVEERGFLTMFEDVSGFGSWHRRWCVLSGYCISYWTYPDDEKRKNPMGRINLANCTSHKVEPANREFCARPNTFELITVRPQREDDRETLVSQCHNTMCVTKNWLSADTKDERNLWMQKLNQILVDLRTWQPDSCYRPI